MKLESAQNNWKKVLLRHFVAQKEPSRFETLKESDNHSQLAAGSGILSHIVRRQTIVAELLCSAIWFVAVLRLWDNGLQLFDRQH